MPLGRARGGPPVSLYSFCTIKSLDKGRAFCEANTHKTSYLFFTRDDVDDFEKNQSIELCYHTPTGLERELIHVVLQWYFPKVWEIYIAGKMRIWVGT